MGYPVVVPQIVRRAVDRSKLNEAHPMAFGLRLNDFVSAMEDVYDFFYDVNTNLTGKGLRRLEDMMRPANLSGTLSDMLTDSLAQHSRSLTPNLYHNGHPDLIVRDRYPNDAVQSGVEGVEVKTTRKKGGAVDSHGAREQTLAVFVYDIDNDPAKGVFDREPLKFTEIYLGSVVEADYRRNDRGTLGTRTATLDAAGIAKYRKGWVYKDLPNTVTAKAGKAQPWRQPNF